MAEGTVFGPHFETRVAPRLGVHQMKTFQIDQPLSTHFRPASCQEVDCSKFNAGWETGFDISKPGRYEAANELGKVATRLGRKFTVKKVGDTVTFTFSAGQPCLEGHNVPLERDPFMIVRDGDWRGNPTRQSFRHTSAESFVDNWQSDMQPFIDRQNAG